MSGVQVELTSQEFQVPVEDWVRDEKVRAPNGLKTDALGQLRIEGLPRGGYSWSVGGVQPSSGSFTLVPAANALTLRLSP